MARALIAWAEGFPVVLLDRVPSAAEVLGLQATGRRCVSLLAASEEKARQMVASLGVVHSAGHLHRVEHGVVATQLKLRLRDGAFQDLSSVRVVGIFDMDMIAHNRDDRPDIIQIAPGKSPESLQCAYQAFLAASMNQTAAGRG